MIRIFKLALLIFVITASGVVLADCPSEVTLSGNLKIQREWDAERGVCRLLLLPRNTTLTPQYRAFSFDSTGLFTVLNSYGRGSSQLNLGFREFFILPAVNLETSFKIEQNRDVTVTLVSNHQLRVSGRDLSVVSFEPGVFQEFPLAKDNAGGFEFRLGQGFSFDGGFKIGVRPLNYPLSTSVIRSAKSSSIVSCRLLNQDILSYKGKSGEQNYRPALGTEELIDFLSMNCGQLKF